MTIKLLAPFIFFELLYEITYFLLYGETSKYLKIGAPYWILWYLPALFVWRFMLHYFIKLPYPLCWAIAASLLIGFTNAGYTLSISRIVVFFPFFIMGYLIKDINKATITTWISPTISLLLFWGILLTIMGILNTDPLYDIFYGSKPYHDIVFIDNAWIGRAVWIFIATFLSLGLVSMISARKSILTKIGQFSIGIYLGHGIAIELLFYYFPISPL